MSTANRTRQADNKTLDPSTEGLTTIHMGLVPQFIRELHELVLDEHDKGQFVWTDKSCLATFWDAEKLFPNIPDLKNVDSIQLVYAKPEEELDEYYYSCY